jgi:hypothetical protein
MAHCLRCTQPFQPRKDGHVFCRPRCRHSGVRRRDEPEPPSEELLAKLFDPERNEKVLVDPDDWHPGPPEWAKLDSGDTVATRRRWFKALMAEGRI